MAFTPRRLICSSGAKAIQSSLVNSPDLRWRVCGHRPLLWRAWDGLHVLYHPDSGDTHVLDEIGAAVIHTLERSPALADDVLGRVAAELNQPRGQDLDQHVGQLLTELATLGLIEQVTPSNR